MGNCTRNNLNYRQNMRMKQHFFYKMSVTDDAGCRPVDNFRKGVPSGQASCKPYDEWNVMHRLHSETKAKNDPKNAYQYNRLNEGPDKSKERSDILSPNLSFGH